MNESRLVMPDSLQPHRLHSPWNSPGQNTGVGSLSLLQGGSSQPRDRTQEAMLPLSFFKKKNVFISLCQMLVEAHEAFGCGICTVSCSLWDIVP